MRTLIRPPPRCRRRHSCVVAGGPRRAGAGGRSTRARRTPFGLHAATRPQGAAAAASRCRRTHGRIVFPNKLRARAIVDLDLPLWAGRSSPRRRSTRRSPCRRPDGSYHDRRAGERRQWSRLEVDRPTVGRLLVPLFVDRGGIWILRTVAPAGRRMDDRPRLRRPSSAWRRCDNRVMIGVYGAVVPTVRCTRVPARAGDPGRRVLWGL
jgi:hypothetical protein